MNNHVLKSRVLRENQSMPDVFEEPVIILIGEGILTAEASCCSGYCYNWV